ncbi:MAG: hypothetical protein K2M17_02685 [Bacilli bacterium]|nr:hypothetical protein [Bacilli bacterium]
MNIKELMEKIRDVTLEDQKTNSSYQLVMEILHNIMGERAEDLRQDFHNYLLGKGKSEEEIEFYQGDLNIDTILKGKSSLDILKLIDAGNCFKTDMDREVCNNFNSEEFEAVLTKILNQDPRPIAEIKNEIEKKYQEEFGLTLFGEEEEISKPLAIFDELDTEPKPELSYTDWIKKVYDFFKLLPFINSLSKKIYSFGESLVFEYYVAQVNEVKYTEFYHKLVELTNHDQSKSIYHYHGTQCLDDAWSIKEQGLFLCGDICYTAYSEMSADTAITYDLGGMEHRGRDAIVVIEQPIVDGIPIEIRRKLSPEEKEVAKDYFCASGTRAIAVMPEYIIDPQYIIAIINKKNQKIEYTDLKRI